jgi:hypothetical protein
MLQTWGKILRLCWLAWVYCVYNGSSACESEVQGTLHFIQDVFRLSINSDKTKKRSANLIHTLLSVLKEALDKIRNAAYINY